MPVNRRKWLSQIYLSSFINTSYQVTDLQQCKNARNILIVGPGHGLDTNILKWCGYTVTTFDIDKIFQPDVIGSVHDLGMFNDNAFDVAIASHVLEHLPVYYLDMCISELARVAKYSLIYLPIAGWHFQIRCMFGFKNIDLSWFFDFFNYFDKPDGLKLKYCQGQHYWEIGRRGFRVKDIVIRLKKQFEIIRHYRNRDWNPSYNFVLKSKE